MISKENEKFQVSMPFYEIRMSVTGACNHNCVYCEPFVDGKHSKGYGNISINQVVDFTERFKDFFKKEKLHLQITGGEATLREDLVDIFATLNKEIKDIGISTNGSNLNLRLAKDLVNNGLSDIHIHLPSLDKEISEKTTQRKHKGNYIKKITDTALYIKSTGTRVEFNSPVTNINILSLVDLLDFCYQNKINLKLIEELRLDNSEQIKFKTIKKLLSDWMKKNKIQTRETKIKNKYGIIYNLDKNFFFRIAPVDKNFKKNLKGLTKKTLLDGRYWVGGRDGHFLFTSSYSKELTKGDINDLEKNLNRLSKIYKEKLKIK
jgi:molybdenum cofactor biosynthesis enzyme MoaA